MNRELISASYQMSPCGYYETAQILFLNTNGSILFKTSNIESNHKLNVSLSIKHTGGKFLG
jgi:hypothetical protein